MAHPNLLLKSTILLLTIFELGFGAVLPVSEALSSSLDGSKVCNLIFNIERTTDGQAKVSSISMPPLEQIMSSRGQPNENVCNIVFALQPTIELGASSEQPELQKPLVFTTTTRSPKKPVTQHAVETTTTTSTRRPSSTTKRSTTTTRRPRSTTKRPQTTTRRPHSTTRRPSSTTPVSHNTQHDDIQPIYELQLAVWPSDVEDFIDALPEDTIGEEEVFQPEDEHTPTTVEMAPVPVYEDQIVVFPDLSESTQKPDSSTEHPIVVVQNMNQKHANGTIESKLVLSNGVVNYKKIYKKMKNGANVTVHEGYDTVPIPGKQDKYQTQYYISDNRGHRVYKVEQTIGKPVISGN